jgi:hypothetical protein
MVMIGKKWVLREKPFAPLFFLVFRIKNGYLELGVLREIRVLEIKEIGCFDYFLPLSGSTY